MSGYIAEFTAPDGSTATVGSDDIVKPDVPDEHSVINEFSFRVEPDSPTLEQFRHGSVALFFEADDGTQRLIQAGPVDAVLSDDSAGRTTIRAKDDLQRLKRDGPNGTITADGEAADEIERVWGMTAFDADVTKPEPRPVADDKVIQDGDLDTVYSDLPDTDPFTVSASELKPVQTCFHLDARTDATNDDRSFNSNDKYTDGTAALYFGTDNFSEYQITPPYTIPAENVQISFLIEGLDTDGVDVDVSISDGTSTDTLNDNPMVWNSQVLAGFDWYDINFFTTTSTPGFDLQAGTTYTVRTDVVGATGQAAFDRIAIYDDRYESQLTFDATVDSAGGQIDGPELIPDELQAVADTADVPNSITAARLTVSSDTGNKQALGLEFGPGDDFAADLSGSNTLKIEGDNTGEFVNDIRGAVTLGNKGQTRDDSPKTGYEAQSLTDWELAVDEVSVIVFNGRVFTGNWYQIIQEMHAEGNLIFRNIPDENGLKAETFEKGALSDSADWTRLGFKRGYENVNDYANELFAVGGKPDDGSDRPTVTVDDSDEKSRVGATIPTYRLFENFTTENGLRNRAQAELRGLTDDQLSGTMDIVPRRLKPGYAYTVDAFNGETVVLERQRFSDGKQPSGSLEFEQRRDVSNAISSVRREARSGER